MSGLEIRLRSYGFLHLCEKETPALRKRALFRFGVQLRCSSDGGQAKPSLPYGAVIQVLSTDDTRFQRSEVRF
ncbi:hypothetical protein Y032_0016g2892 [Ancylostoma ceylanicum]|uniref:Uncharacterized protein n=1 Tax=Ancylostoma ceylanicum TaxID=53326 RepID=A0A016V6P7_9BILA|nr:hypothetical protein Y032_0016g2892 [Ancylostoma ceylanicum]